ncbi:MAG: AmmeMemoRadiSam system protein B [Candidatus Yanofskybacteria bacterium RIFCSPHIGHO2_01_FULL_44_17]|uniref:AmmeMemoRadiSam system protein B n=1 Tax=Candidatus Yanofskybacteria bacterium RIFCSPHIGHO2_01_FULL_44_17 TaxID=1802668 RepID=A0A1F8ETP0_9BACT|nr:MAG: AmmeMemoRadiSam system protein B [Candidatus Yanofskybacteria bacterium RIFCSPHIGHO2_01_FULL_44_17]
MKKKSSVIIAILILSVFLILFFANRSGLIPSLASQYKKTQLAYESRLEQSGSSIIHQALFKKTDFYMEAFKLSKVPASPDAKLVAAITNHHLIAPEFIAKVFSLVQTSEPITVVLLSPNHFSVGNGYALVSEAKWETPYGQVIPDLHIVEELQKRNLVQVDEGPFEKEHGITGIVGFMKKSLPNAKIVPLILKESISVAQINDLAKSLDEILDADDLLIGSFDFSHDFDLTTSNRNDELSLSILEKQRLDQITQMNVDSRKGVELLLGFVSLRGANKFTLLDHSNSALITGNLEQKDVTSYITGYFTRQK